MARRLLSLGAVAAAASVGLAMNEADDDPGLSTRDQYGLGFGVGGGIGATILLVGWIMYYKKRDDRLSALVASDHYRVHRCVCFSCYLGVFGSQLLGLPSLVALRPSSPLPPSIGTSITTRSQLCVIACGTTALALSLFRKMTGSAAHAVSDLRVVICVSSAVGALGPRASYDFVFALAVCCVTYLHPVLCVNR
jgi:hypothetical protein